MQLVQLRRANNNGAEQTEDVNGNGAGQIGSAVRLYTLTLSLKAPGFNP
jgi:hypothetical protein